MKEFKEWFAEKYGDDEWRFWFGDVGEEYTFVLKRMCNAAAEYIAEAVNEEKPE